MSYDFSFNKKSIFVIAGGCLAIGVLLFFAGFVVGWDRGTYEARLEFQNQPATVTAQKLPPQASREAPAPETKPASSSPQQESVASTKNSLTLSPATQPTSTEVKANQPQAPPPKPAAVQSEEDLPVDASGFSLQVGAFQNENNALRCQNNLKSKGYPVFVFHTQDAGGRPWHTVRIGHYSDIKKASEAAVAFTGKEKLPVFIRPVNEL